jgi:hypothetical protein
MLQSCLADCMQDYGTDPDFLCNSWTIVKSQRRWSCILSKDMDLAPPKEDLPEIGAHTVNSANCDGAADSKGEVSPGKKASTSAWNQMIPKLPWHPFPI